MTTLQNIGKGKNASYDDGEINSISEKLQKSRKRAETVKSELAAKKKKLEQEKVELNRLLESQKVIQTVAQQVQQQVHKTVSSLVSESLKTIFGDSYGFEIQFEKKRGKTEAVPVLTKGELKLDLKDTTGGGVLDVVSFALRVAYLTLSRPEVRQFLVLDEPFKFLDATKEDKVRVMLEEFSSKLGIQILMTTHTDAYKVGKVIQIGES